MRSLVTKVCVVSILAIFLSASTCAAKGADVPLIGDEWVHFALWKLETSGIIDPIFASSRPYEREEIARVVSGALDRINEGSLHPKPHELELIKKLEAEFSGDLKLQGLDLRGSVGGKYEYYDDEGLPGAALWGAASYHLTPNIMLYEEIDVQRSRRVVGEEGKTASKRINQWKWDYTGDFCRGYIRFHWDRFEALLGRQSLFWGPGYDGSLVLSDNSPAFDMVLLKAKLGPVRAVAFTAILDKMWNGEGYSPDRYLANRYLSGHRIDWQVNDRIALGLSELVLYGGEAQGMELYYVNPIIPYYASQWNSDLDDNVLICADFAVRPVDGLKIYGQFLVDDYSYAGGDPNALGYIAGLYLSDPLGSSGIDFRAEYTRVDTWTYTHLETENQFTHFAWIIGHHIGPDADQMLVELGRMITKNTRVRLSYIYGRQGIRSVADRYRTEDYEHIDFPSPPVEYERKMGFQFLREPVRGPQINVSLESSSIKNHYRAYRKEYLASITAGFLLGVRHK